MGHQAKELLKKYGVNVLQGSASFNSEDSLRIAKDIGGSLWVVKAQIHAGGRGKAGGVKIARTLEEVKKITDDLLGTKLVTHQTGPKGQLVKRVFIESGCFIEKEFYIS